MRTFHYGLALIAALAFAACGGESTPAEQGTGNLHATVQNLTTADVASVTLDMTGDTAYSFDLALDATSGDWVGTQNDVFVGDYTVTATAFDSTGVVIFESGDTTVTITKGNTATATILLNEVTGEGTIDAPRFASISRDKAVVQQNETLGITVTVTGGTAPYTIDGRHALSEPHPGTFSNQNFTGTTGTLTWTPPAFQGPAWFIVSVTDANGNMVEVGVDVEVGSDLGSFAPVVTFNMAPTVEVQSGMAGFRVENDADGTAVYLTVDLSDAEGSAIDYAFTSDCGPNFQFTTGAATGNVASGSSVGIAFKDQSQSAATRDRDPNSSCNLTLTVTDADLASRAVVFPIQTGWVEPTTTP